MDIFKRTQLELKKYNNFCKSLDNIVEELLPYAEATELSTIEDIKKNFISKTDDFFRNDRKLNIAVIGQVKAGKSSFLNTMLFEGMDILPKASTPKTATLTKIEYSNENTIIVEYYSPQEWKTLEENAKLDLEIQQVQVAKEIINMVKKNGINPQEYLDKGEAQIKFDSYNELMGELNKFVGENGIYTPLVKSVILKIDNPNLKEISVVDTPGLNDPIVSRTDKTKQFLEMCDVVFFLSRASQFLDSSDMELLSMQLPQKGVKKLVLIASKYDEGLMDVIDDYDGLEEADIETKVKLKKEARGTFEKTIQDYEARGLSNEIIDVIKDCKSPIFVSSMTHNMSQKEKEEYTEEEAHVMQNLSEYEELTKADLENIGNIAQVKAIFEEVIAKKEETLENKSDSFIPTAEQELRQLLISTKEKAAQKLKILASTDKEKLTLQRKAINTQINEISASIETVFGSLMVELDKNKNEAVQSLREKGNEYSSIKDKEGKEAKTGTRTVSTSKWWNPFSWGSKSTSTYTYYEYYYYLETSDALENLRCYSNESANLVEDVFNKTIDIPKLKRKLLTVVLQNLDTSDESYDSSYFKLMVERILNDIQIPYIKIDVSDFLKEMSSKFSGEIKDTKEKEALRKLLSDCVEKLFDTIIEKLMSEMTCFRSKMTEIKVDFADKLLESINQEFNLILEQLENKESEIQKTKKLQEVLEKIIV